MADRLRELQARFLAGVIAGDADAESLIIDDNRVGATRRLDIYRNNYRSSLTGVLADHFERLHAYVGDEQFDNLADAFVTANPSSTRNLRYYGQAFPDFLAQHFPDDGELAELARIDWALCCAFDAADQRPLDAATVSALGDGWIERPLALHASAGLLSTRFNSIAIWSALDSEADPPEAQRLPDPVPVLVWRHGVTPQFRSLSDDEAAALSRVDEGASFSQLAASMLDRMGEEAAMSALGGWLATWLGDELLVLAD